MSTIDRILLLKEERHLTNKEIETGAGLANSSISQWTRNKGKPSLENIIKLAKFFHVSSDYLLGLTDERNRDLQPLGYEISLSEDEQILLESYHRASTLEQFRIIQLCMNTMDAADRRRPSDSTSDAGDDK